MSEPRDDQTLDTLDKIIDESARSLTAAESPLGLRARVFERIQEDADRRRRPRWLVPGIAIASACIAAVAIYVGSDFRRSNDRADVGSGSSRSNESRIRLPSTSLRPGKPDPTTETSIRLPSTSLSPGKPDPTTETSSVVQSEPPPGFESIGAAALTIDALGVTGLPTPAGISVESIPVETIEIAALGTE